MIRLKSVRMVNFRKYKDTTIEFDDTSQLIMVTGRNGVGKTTVLEAIKVGLYGSARKSSPRITMKELVRWGHTDEGFRVELGFTDNANDYLVERTWSPSSGGWAQLLVDGVPRFQGSSDVTTEIARLTGLDMNGWLLAVSAEQKDVAGLVSMSPAKRRATMSRLAGLDVLNQSAAQAKTLAAEKKKSIKVLGDSPSVEAIRDRLDDTQEAFETSQAALLDANEEIERLVSEINSRQDVQAKHSAAVRRHSEAVGALESARRLLEEAEGEFADAQAAVPDEKPDVLDVSAAHSALEAADARAVELQEKNRTWGDVQDTLSRISRLEAILDSIHVGEEPSVDGAEEVFRDACKRLAEVSAEELSDTTVLEGNVSRGRRSVSNLTTTCGVLESSLQDIIRNIESLSTKESEVCPECGQAVDAEHTEKLLQSLEEKEARTREELGQAREDLREAEKSLMEDEAELKERSEKNANLSSRVREAEVCVRQAQSELRELQTRREMWSSRVAQRDRAERDIEELTSKLPDGYESLTPVDPAELSRAEAAVKQARDDVNKALESQGAAARYERLVLLASQAETSMLRRKEAVSEAELVEGNSRVPQDLLDAMAELDELGVKLAAEKELAGECKSMMSGCSALVGSLTDQLKEAEKEHERRSKLMDDIESADGAHTILRQIAADRSAKIRPQLQGATSAILSKMSNDRFSRVRIKDDFSVQVEDGGKFRNMNALSGGESDLVALALRLGLSSVVNGGVNPGYLILDEVFGSQDQGRREAIVEGLRQLRGTYGQVLMISHVGGFEDLVDSVVNVTDSVSESGDRTADAEESAI